MLTITRADRAEGRRLLIEAAAALNPTSDEAQTPEGQRVIAAFEELCIAIDELHGVTAST